jgi:hypothetical protein
LLAGLAKSDVIICKYKVLDENIINRQGSVMCHQVAGVVWGDQWALRRKHAS